MLKKIIADLYVDPEILAELSDDQKQILFCKMREEQVRRWKEKEAAKEKEDKKKKKHEKKKSSSKTVGFLQGADGKDWVWVMGDHKNDQTIEEILEKEQIEKARILAEKESEELRKKEEEEIQKKLEEEKHRLERERIAHEEELRRKEQEAAIYQSLKEARLAAQKLEEERRKQEEEEKKMIVKMRQKAEQQLCEVKRRDIQRRSTLDKRSSKYLESFKETRRKFEQAAEETSQVIENEWLKQEQKSKQAEEEMRLIARKAREEHKRAAQIKLDVVSAFQSNIKPPVPPKRGAKKPPKPKPERPTSYQSVVDWFKDEELPKGVGKDPVNGAFSDWFHGIISREDAERALSPMPTGTFMVRVNLKIWGYALSYKDHSRCKHFLIDTSDDTYQFFGINQIAHKSLHDLVEYHKNNPISRTGTEYLTTPCGQQVAPPDYGDLFEIQTTQL